MTSSYKSKFVLSSLILVGTNALLPLACGGDDKKSSSDTATGGTTHDVFATGGASAGTDASGGATSSAANSSGGTSAPDSTSVANAGAPTTLPQVDCTSDIECKQYDLLCDTNTQKCVQCKTASDCSAGVFCVAGVCGGSGGCKTNAECAGSSKGAVCDATRGRCVGCVTASDCPDPSASACVANACVTFESCKDSRDCDKADEVCDTLASRCVSCVSSADCNLNGKTGFVCANNRCTSGCTASENCTGANKLCNTTASEPYCAQCLSNTDCAAAQHCSKGECVADSCAAGVDQACINGGVATCNEAGDGFGPSTACPTNLPCTVIESRAACGNLNPGTCAEKNAKPCTAIPQFVGTQVVDLDGNDLCGVPGFVLGFNDTAAKIYQAEGQTASATSYQEIATFRIAWSATHVHAYVEVADSSVNPNSNPADIWNGDSVEFMISTNRNVTGLTSTDANTLHVIGNSIFGVTVKASGTSGTHSQIYDANQFKSKATEKGYAFELMLPWPDGSTMSAGTPIYFDAALNSASKNTDGTAPRQAQAILFQANTPAAQTSCTGTGVGAIAPFCDDRLWCPTQAK